jgi:hypothetical protein
MSEHHWISGAIKHHGVFRAAAKNSGMSTEAFARKHEHASGVLGHRARLALTLMHLHKHDSMAGDSDEEKDAFHSAVERNKK